MNDNINTPTLDNDQIDALMAELHEPGYPFAGNPTDAGDGEDAQPEGAFISEDSTSVQLN